MKHRCLQMFLLSAMFVSAPTQVIGRCIDGTTFTAISATSSSAIGSSNAKIDCVTNPPNQAACFWVWQYKVNELWSVVSNNASGPTTGYYILLQTGSLFISPVRQAHGTTYVCTNPSTPRIANIPTVLYLQAQLSYVENREICVELGANGTLPFVAYGYPSPSLYLYKQVQDTWTLVTDRRFVLGPSSLSITFAQAADSGMYLLRANISSISSTAELVFPITVSGNEAPVATLFPNSSMTIARESQSLNLICSIQAGAFRNVNCNGNPTPQPTTIRWTKNGEPIEQNKPYLYSVTNLSTGVSILRSEYLTSELSGQYACEASNALGYSVVSTKLQVYKVCEVNPCLNGGTCISDESGLAYCLCSDRYSGDYCENSIVRSVHHGEFQTGVVIWWEFTASALGSVDLRLNNNAGTFFVISVNFEKKYVSFSNSSAVQRGYYDERKYNFPFASNNSVIAIVVEKDGFAISSKGKDFMHHFAHNAIPSGPVDISTTTGLVAIGQRMFIPSYQPGTVIYVQGIVPRSGDFVIQLHTADPWKLTIPNEADIALSIRPLLNQSIVLLNSRVAGNWGSPQVEREFPLSASKPFIIAITWQLYGYEIAINGVHYSTFNNRLPFTLTNTVMTSSLEKVSRIRLY